MEVDNVLDLSFSYHVQIYESLHIIDNFLFLFSYNNLLGIIKILKKYDKRTGGLLRVHFTQLALRQPFFTTEPLTRLVHECEENLELLFPLEAEVIESTTTTTTTTTSTSTTTTLALNEETSDVYRRTVDAIKTIKGLKKESSTSNPLSFASIFGNQDMDTGAVTAEDSRSDLSGSDQNEQECDDGHSGE